MIKKSLILLSFLVIVQFVYSQNIRLMTYNIRYDNPGDGEDRWAIRKENLCKQIMFYEPDVLGIQEGLLHQLSYMDSSLLKYSYLGVGRDDGKKAGEYCAIFYHTGHLKLLKQSTFWLNENPDSISKGWDAALPRICTFAQFETIKNKKKFWVFNTHFDHIGEIARNKSAELIINKINQLNINNLPLILMGDFNLEPESEAIRYISGKLHDTKFMAQNVTFGPEGTFNGFEFDKPVEKRIDYIFINSQCSKVMRYGVLSDSYNCHYLSDHLPVFVELSRYKK